MMGTAQFIAPKEAAVLLGLSEQTLANWRVQGKGPRFHKFGSRVSYDRDEVLAWANRNKFSNTGEYQSEGR